MSGADQSMPEGAATLQNATSSGKAGIAANGNGASSKSHHHHHHMTTGSSAPTTGAPQ